MGLLALLTVALGGAVATLLTGRWPLARAALAVLALAACAILAYALDPTARVTVGDGALLAGRYLRLWLLSAALALLLLQLLTLTAGRADGLATGRADGLAPAALVVIAMGTLALALPDAMAGLLIVTAGAALLDLAAAHPTGEGPAGLGAAVDALRVTVLAAVLGVAGFAWASEPGLGVQPTTVLAAYLLVAAAVGLRVGAVPLHLPAARLAEAVPRPLLPLLVGWLPAVFALVALGWFAAVIVPLTPDLGWARVLVIAIGLITLAATSLAMLLQEDLGHLLGYAAIQGGALALLALASLEPATAAQVRVWLLILPLTLAALSATVLVLEAAFGTRRVGELTGWLRRAPVTGMALLLAVVGTYGLPGLLQFEARREVLTAAAGPTWGTLGLLAAGLAIVAWIRFAWVGLQAAGPAVAGGTSERPARPAAGQATASPGATGSTRRSGLPGRRDTAASIRAGVVTVRAWAASLRAGGALGWAGLALNRVPVAALLALLLALLPIALGLGLGHLGVVAAEPIPVARPTVRPAPTGAPSTSPGPPSSPRPAPSPTGAAQSPEASTQRSTSRA